MKWLILLLAMSPGCEFTLRFGDMSNRQPEAKPVARQDARPIPNPTGHDTIDRIDGWEAIEKKRRGSTPEEYEAWLEEHRTSQDLGPIGGG